MGLRVLQGKRSSNIAGEFLDAAERDTSRIKGQVVGGHDLGLGSFNRGGIGDIEVTLTGIFDQPGLNTNAFEPNPGQKAIDRSLPVIGNIDYCFLALVAHEFHLVLNGKHRLGGWGT